MDKTSKVIITKGDGYMCIEVVGHNSDPLICSALSAIMQTTEAGLKTLAIGRPSVIIKEVHEDICDL